jgi:hypothetical protein
MARVTVLMAVRDGARFLRPALDGLMAQTLADFELIVVDDGSTDASAAIVRSYRDPRIVFIETGRRLGQTRALNRGLALATGTYVARQDADDVSAPERLARQAAFLESHPEVALVGCWYRVIDAEGRTTAERELPCADLDLRWALLFFCPFVHSAVMFRRAVIPDRLGLYDERFAYSQDYELWLRVARGCRVANLPETLVGYRRHDASMTAAEPIVAGEGARLRASNLARLLAWPEGRSELHASRLAAMTRLYFSTSHDLTPADALAAASDLIALHPGFRREFCLDPAEADPHLRRVRARLTARLLDLARNRLGDRDLGGALALACRALRVRFRSDLGRPGSGVDPLPGTRLQPGTGLGEGAP